MSVTSNLRTRCQDYRGEYLFLKFCFCPLPLKSDHVHILFYFHLALFSIFLICEFSGHTCSDVKIDNDKTF